MSFVHSRFVEAAKKHCVRVPKPYKIFRNRRSYHEFPSKKETAEFMVENHFWDLKVCTMCGIISRFPNDGSKDYYGFTFEGDPDWIPSKPV